VITLRMNMRALLDLNVDDSNGWRTDAALSLRVFGRHWAGLGILLVYVSCYAPSAAPRALLMLGTACVMTRFTAPR
jgi:hypothetical protein